MAEGVSLSRKCQEMEESRMGEQSHGEAEVQEREREKGDEGRCPHRQR